MAIHRIKNDLVKQKKASIKILAEPTKHLKASELSDSNWKNMVANMAVAMGFLKSNDLL